ncbi:hypothetical protein [Streptomyces sannanensis]|uniref:hypothetical protein n=1 Tax=Streptomyces sannanensis TaxID=285536 RepID=UPI0031ECD24E
MLGSDLASGNILGRERQPPGQKRDPDTHTYNRDDKRIYNASWTWNVTEALRATVFREIPVVRSPPSPWTTFKDRLVDLSKLAGSV